jgi:hypothetical protein
VMKTPYSYQESPRYDPAFDFRRAHLEHLGEAMVELLRQLGRS